MMESIETRELIRVRARGSVLRGTYHRARETSSGEAICVDVKNRIGILFLNPGVLPRAATGDSAVYWAESFAKLGYPSFRVDLPGFGDSDGEIPREVLDFQTAVNRGGYASHLSSAAENLVERFHLSGVVLFGHCAGAVSALYAATMTQRLKGLVLLDPYFQVQQKITNRNVLSRWNMHIIRRIERSVAPSVSNRCWRAEAELLWQLKKIYHRLKQFCHLERSEGLPGNANLPLIRCWNQLESARLPLLVLRSRAASQKSGEFDYLSDRQSSLRANSRAVVRLIDGTTHSFAEGQGKVAVREYVEQWLRESFPINNRTQDQVSLATTIGHHPDPTPSSTVT
jgi:pimeloyl-ACP methyl ester carboxylesterase